MNPELDILGLVLGASLPVKIVMIMLLLASIASWMIIFRKKAMIDRALREARDFEERFWSGADLAAVFRDITARNEQLAGMEAIFEAGFREFAKLRQRRGLDPRRRQQRDFAHVDARQRRRRHTLRAFHGHRPGLRRPRHQRVELRHGAGQPERSRRHKHQESDPLSPQLHLHLANSPPSLPGGDAS